jgi:plasmid maintenance system antidote protein VapI
MRSDFVVLNGCVLENVRRERALSRFRFFTLLGVHPRTGSKLINRKPVSIITARRVATALNIEVGKLIEFWLGENEQMDDS